MRVLPGSSADVVRALDASIIRCDCGAGLRRWGWARARIVRWGDRRLRLRPRRGRCRGCGSTHVLLPGLCLSRRLDAVEVIGSALDAARSGRGARRIAAGLGVPASTVRDWFRAFRRRGSPWPDDAPMAEGAGGMSRWRAAGIASSGMLLAPLT